MATIKRNAGKYRDFTFTPSDYDQPTTLNRVITYTAKTETGIGFGHPPGPAPEKRDEFLYIQSGDKVNITASSGPAPGDGSGPTNGDIEIDIADIA